MKENSIEEDIKDIEKYISFTSKRENFSHDTDWNWNKDLANKIEHILSDYKRVLEMNEVLLKENEELKDKYATFVKMSSEVIANSIPTQKVKDKIKEVQKEYNKLDKQVDEYINDANKDLSKYYENKEKIGTMQTLAWVIDNLQELLEGRK